MSFTSVDDSTEIGQERKKDKRKNKMGKKSQIVKKPSLFQIQDYTNKMMSSFV